MGFVKVQKGKDGGSELYGFSVSVSGPGQHRVSMGARPMERLAVKQKDRLELYHDAGLRRIAMKKSENGEGWAVGKVGGNRAKALNISLPKELFGLVAHGRYPMEDFGDGLVGFTYRPKE